MVDQHHGGFPVKDPVQDQDRCKKGCHAAAKDKHLNVRVMDINHGEAEDDHHHDDDDLPPQYLFSTILRFFTEIGIGLPDIKEDQNQEKCFR